MSNTGLFVVLFENSKRGKAIPEFKERFTAFVKDHPVLKNLEFDKVLHYGEEHSFVVSGDCDWLRPCHMVEFFGGAIPENTKVLVQDANYFPDRWIDCGNKEELE